jgi:hypothetical protein
MGKGSGTCDRPGISLGTFDSAETESVVSGGIAEINTTLELQRIGKQWWTKDERVSFQKRKQGWVVGTYSGPVHKAFEEYGLLHQQADTSIYDPTFFPSLKAARQAVSDVSLEAGLNIDSRLTRQKFISYKIGDLPLSIGKPNSYWQVYMLSLPLPQSLEKHFNSVEEFRAAWESTNSAFAHHPTRKAGHQAVTNWLSQTIIEEK